jgi:hypothetical protein
MPLALLLTVISAALVIHAAKTGRFTPWGYLILFLPGIGAVAYVLMELIPEWMGSPQGQRAGQRVARTLDPEKRYRQLRDELDVADTVAIRSALANECLVLGKYEEAKQHFEHVLAQPVGDDPNYALGKAHAEFGLGDALSATATLDELRRRWPEFQSAEGHLLYARALERSGRQNDALDEYRAVAEYYPGAQARVRYGLLLRDLGRHAEATALFADLVKQMRRTPRYVRKAQAEWIAIAENALRR